jgi:hypothetical protein
LCVESELLIEEQGTRNIRLADCENKRSPINIIPNNQTVDTYSPATNLSQ